jgi:hypothetical protein
MTEAKGLETPGVTDAHEESSMEENLMKNELAARYRSAAAKLNYASLDNPRIAFAAKEVSRTMAKPLQGDEVRLKRILRFLRNCPVSECLYVWQDMPGEIDGFSDSDWAGCRRTRRSTSGGVVLHGAHLIGHWSKTQVGIALSSCEAELNSALKMGTELIGLKHTLSEWGVQINLRLHADSSPLKGLLERRGTGKIKHLEMKQLWLQEKVRAGEIEFLKVPRKDNSSDALTHHWTRAEGADHFGRIGII